MTSNQVFRCVAICLAFSLTLLGGLNSAIAQNKEIPAAEPVKKTITWSVEEIENRIQDLNIEIKAAEEAQNEQSALEPGVTLRDLQERNAKLRTTRWSLKQLQTALKKKSALQRDADIVIAFPQRDVYLDTQQPLELGLIDMKDSSGPNRNPVER
jgi:hypothetical protein